MDNLPKRIWVEHHTDDLLDGSAEVYFAGPPESSVCPVSEWVRPQSVGWQPIETAPKDGTRILVWAQYHLGHPAECLIVWWEEQEAPEVRYVPVEGDLYRREVYRPGVWKDGAWGAIPTHWMPLPEPPAQGSLAGADGVG